jgi:hypothetical protein
LSRITDRFYSKGNDSATTSGRGFWLSWPEKGNEPIPTAEARKMRIPAYIPQLPHSGSGQQERPNERGITASKGHQNRARDSYQFNAAAASVIEAEYVDLPSSSTRLAAAQQQFIPALQQDLPQLADQAPPPTRQASSALLARLQTAPADVPAPGSYLNLYA